MLMDVIGKDHGNQLGNSSQQQIGMKCRGILCFTVGKTKTVFEMVDGLFDNAPDFIDSNPLESSPKGTRIGPEIFFRIDVKHPTTGRRSTGIFAETLTFGFPDLLFDPFCFGTGKFKPDQAVLSFSLPFGFHGK